MKLIVPDYLVILSVILFLGAHMITVYIVESKKDVARELQINEQAAEMIEANPVARKMFNIKQIGYVLWYIWIPALLFSVYYLIRRFYRNDPHVVNFYALLMFSVAIIDVLNDLAILAAYLI